MERVSRIIYCSRSRLTGGPSEIEAQIRKILAKARIFNKKVHLSGAMSFNESYFAQVLEGADKDLLPLLYKIRRDERHTDMKVLLREENTPRIFSTWSMAYVAALAGSGRHPLSYFSFEAALTDRAGPEGHQILATLSHVVLKRTKVLSGEAG